MPQEKIDNNVIENDDDHNSDDSESDFDIPTSCNDNTLLCVVWCENSISILLLPCNHFKLCSPCHEQIKAGYIRRNNGPMLCLICRSIVEDTSKIYA